MNDESPFDEDVLEAILLRADDKVLVRGQNIGRDEIRSMVRDGTRIRARVRGSEIVPYRVDIDAETGENSCTCPYDWGEVCKHTVAVAQLALVDGEAIEEISLQRHAAINLDAWGEDDVIALLDQLKEKFPQAVREFVAEEMRELEYGDPDEEDDW